MSQHAFRQSEKFSRTKIYLCLGTKSKPLLRQINHSDASHLQSWFLLNITGLAHVLCYFVTISVIFIIYK